MKAFADYEQLVGGIETLFGAGGKNLKQYADSVGKTVSEAKSEFEQLEAAQATAMNNAANAYKDAGMSANEYMETISGFAASLKQSTDSELEAAKVANQTVIDMADNANKMGTNIEMIKNAYQGFAKQNYTMLDNLKLGYGGTATEMARLINDSGVLGDKLIDLTDTKNIGLAISEVGLDKIFEAIHLVQTELGITGTTAEEASSTITGSLNMTKAAWSNLLVGMADDNQNFEQLVNNLVDSAAIAAENLLPRIEQVITGCGQLVETLLPVIIERIPQIISDVLPGLVEAGTNAIVSLVGGIRQNLPQIMESGAEILSILIAGISAVMPEILTIAGEIFTILLHSIGENAPQIMDAASGMIKFLYDGLASSLPQIADAGVEILNFLTKGITDNLPDLIPTAMEALVSFSGTLREKAGLLVDAGLELIKSLAQSFIDNIPVFIETVPTIITNLCGIINDNAPKLLTTGIELIGKLAMGLIKAIPTLVKNIPKIIEAVVAVFTAFNWMNLGKNIITFIKDGIKSLSKVIPEKLKSIGKAAKDWIKQIDWKTLGADIIRFIGAGINTLLTFIPNTLKSIGSFAVNKFKSIDWADLGLNLIKGIVGGITGALDGLWTSIGDLCNGILNSIKEFFGIHSPSTVMEEQGNFLVEGMINGLVSLPEKALVIFAQVLDSILLWGANMLSNAQKVSSEFVIGIITFLSELPGKVAAFFAEIIANVIVWGSDMLLNAEKSGREFVTGLINFLSQLPGKVGELIGRVLANVITWGNNMLSKAQKAGKDFVSGVVNFVQELPGKIKEFIDDIIKEVTTFITDFGNKAKEAGEEFFERITGALSDLPDKMWEIGSNIINGIWGGISAGWDWLVGKVKEVAGSLFGAAQEELDVHSPSRKFKWLAEMCVAGFDEGMEPFMNPATMTRNIKASLSAMNASARNGESHSGIVKGGDTNLTLNVYKEIATADELARAARLEIKYGLMKGAPVGE